MTPISQPDVVVIGGGAAGIIAAARAAELGASVMLLEKNPRLGMKILISGGGKCNLTHDGAMEHLRAQFRVDEARFLKPSFYKFTNKQFLDILHQRGMQTYVRPDGRVFPVEPDDAKTVVRLLTDYVRSKGVHIRYECAVSGISVEDGAVRAVRSGDADFVAPRVVVAVGGSSYPATGTTGDGWRWARDVGHAIVPLRAALAPISLVDAKTEWSGVALRDIILKARVGKRGKEFAHWRGDLLYTHKGVSGPTVLGIAREVAERHVDAGGHPVPFFEADLVPDKSFEELRNYLRAEATANPRRTALTLVEQFAPARVIAALLEFAEIDSAQRCGQLPAKHLTRIVGLLKEWPIGTVANVPLERGEVVAGGVALTEVNPQTMESRLVRGLYLCGEVLDIAGPVGGYNLQAAWSTGYVAGTNASGKSN